MAAPTQAQVALQMSALLDRWASFSKQFQDWLAGAASGGPYGDGRYPLTDSKGNTFYVACPAAQDARVSTTVDSAGSYANAAQASSSDASGARDVALQVQTMVEGYKADTLAARDLAKTYADTAGSEAANARASATDAQKARDSAAGSSATANQAKLDAQSAQSAASGSASAASGSAEAASTSAQHASQSAAEAQSYSMTAQQYVTGLLHYMGAWDASTGAFPAGPVKGDFWKVSGAGVVDGVDLKPGDQIIYGGTGWDKIDNTESVTSVAGKVGNVTLAVADVGGLQAALDGKLGLYGPLKVSDSIGRNPNTILPTTVAYGVRFDFINGFGGARYCGLMTFSPWTGNTASTGDASYQLSFGGTAPDGGGVPDLQIRKGIDSTWNSWYRLWHSGNFDPGNYVPRYPGYAVSDANAMAGTHATVLSSTAANTPTNDWATVLQVAGFGSTDRAFQLGHAWNAPGNPLYYRTNVSGTTWNPWRKIWDTSNFDPNAKINVAPTDWADVSQRVNCGFYQTSTPTAGWPAGANGWWHMLSTTHSNTGNYYAMQFACSFYDPTLLSFRVTNGNGGTAWNRVHHSGNCARTFVQAADPGAAANEGDLWIW